MTPDREQPADVPRDSANLAADAAVPLNGAARGAGDGSAENSPAAIEECLRLLERVRQQSGSAAGALSSATLGVQSAAGECLGEPGGGSTNPPRIGRFLIEDRLGEGGHGIVFLAYDPAVGRRVALKVPRPEVLLTDALRERFVREAQLAGGLAHPHLLPVFEADHSGLVCYIASAYCDGPTLAQWLAARQEPAPAKLAAELVADLADAVDYAHRQGVLHRDIKPSNVMLERASSGDRGKDAAMPHGGQERLEFNPRLTDFGLAKLFDSDQTMTRSGAILGTPAYMAPEQAAGNHGTVGRATDVHALGVMLYELLAGRSPFQGVSDADTLLKVTSTEPPSLRAARRDVPRDLEAIALKCLEKEPSRRYAMAGELRDDLRRFLRDEATLARPLGVPGRVVRFARRRPAVAAAGGVVAIALVTLAVGGAWHVRTLARALDESQLARRAAEQSERELREHYYSVDLKAAYDAWRQADVPKAVELLNHQRPRPGQIDLRGFLWRHLWAECHGNARYLAGHAGPVYHVAFSPDGDLLASAGADGTIRLWRPATGETRGTMKGDDREISCIAISSDGQLLASAGNTGVVRLWDVATFRQIDTLGSPDDGFANVAISPDGRTLAAAGKQTTIALWDLAERRLRATLAGHEDTVTCVAFSPDSRWLGSTSTDRTARIWDLAHDNELAYTLTGHEHNVRAIAFSADAGYVATTGTDSTVRLWKRVTGEELFVLRGHQRRVGSVLYSRIDESVTSAGEDGTVRIWNLSAGRPKRTWTGGHGRIWCLAQSPDGRTMAAAGNDGIITLFGLPVGDGVLRPPAPAAFGRGLAFATTGRLVASAEPEGRIVSCDLDRGTTAPLPVAHAGCLRWRLSDKGGTLASAGADGIVRIWTVPDGKLLSTIPDHAKTIRTLAFSPDATQLVTGTGPPEAASRIWDIRSGRILKTLPNGDTTINAQVFSRDGENLAVADTGKQIKVWDVRSGVVRHVLDGHTSEVTSLALSPDGQILASGSFDGTARLWSTVEWKPLGITLPHAPGTFVEICVAFCPDEPVLATGGADAVIHFWHLTTGERLTSFAGHDGPITALCFARNGSWLASGGSKEPAQSLLWRAPRTAE